MIKKLGLVDLHAAIKTKVEQNTGLKCLDEVPKNQPAPFYFVQVIGKRQENTKTMYCEVFSVWLHIIAEAGTGNVRIYKLIELLEEALTEEIELPKGTELITQTEQGLQHLQKDETNENHGILAYDFKVSYGFKTKI